MMKLRSPTASILKDRPIFESAIDRSRRFDASKVSGTSESIQTPLGRSRQDEIPQGAGRPLQISDKSREIMNMRL
jgi:hypothetical protein